MKYFFLYYILGMITHNPLLALLIIFVVYTFIDRQFVGILPDFLTPFRRGKKIAELKRQIAINSYDAYAYYELGALLVEKGDIRGALKYLEKAWSMMPEHTDTLYYWGVACLKSGNSEKGREALKKALEINPKVKYGAPYVYLLEDALLKKQSDNELVNEDEDTVKDYLHKLDLYASPEYYYKLGIIFNKIGKREKAREMFREAISNFKTYPSFYKKKYRYWAFRARIRLLS